MDRSLASYSPWGCKETGLSDFHFTSYRPRGFPGGASGEEPAHQCRLRDAGWIPGSVRSLEKAMAIYSILLAWRTPWTEEPGGLQSMGSQRVGHD